MIMLCPICYEGDWLDYQPNTCIHQFHRVCLAKCVSKGHTTCTVCRTEFNHETITALKNVSQTCERVTFKHRAIEDYVMMNLEGVNSKFRRWIESETILEYTLFTVPDMERWGDCTLEDFAAAFWEKASPSLTMHSHMRAFVRSKHQCTNECLLLPYTKKKYGI